MHSHKSFLTLGSQSATELLHLMKNGYEILTCSFSIQQGVDRTGKATTRVFTSSIEVVLSQLYNGRRMGGFYPRETLRWTKIR